MKLDPYWASTGLLPHVVATCVVGRDERTRERPTDVQDRLAALLVQRADHVVQRNPSFARRLNTKSNLGRDRLYAFMRHWLEGILKEENQ
jgi:hypothetical protein